ncbi:cell wall-binding repeat-containing protein [Wansuia hejianensis]|uniref:Cell wall-binding repeat-containing protein n=1 Tax=Wansuia hejianensis TaxID=2763667 RepID=A0A926EWF2_9FIRM|nr:cell wall-binding repeat-containing protein [Wansuia hejianensis]MBC8590186.1 cell wall-binding repeat-containing protein [Wansuia hejianensis]
MKRFKRFFSIFMILCMILPNISEAANMKVDREVDRIYGQDRIETAINVSNKSYPGKAKRVILAGYSGGADALTGTFYAGKSGAPLLLTRKNRLDPEVLSEIKRLGPEDITILGGEGVVSKEVEDALRNNGFKTKRIKGNNRVETAANVVKSYYGNNSIPEVFIIEYNSLVDALAIGPVAAKKGVPVLISSKDRIPSETLHVLQDNNVKKVTIIGGESAISKTGMAELKKYVPTVERVSGPNRVQTSLAIAKKYFPTLGATIVTNGENYTDALIGGYFAAIKNSPILLANNNNKIHTDVLSYIKNSQAKPFVLGGTAAISSNVFDSIKNAVEETIITEPELPEKPTEPSKPEVPEKPKQPMVCLDYGHGGNDPGAVNKENGRKEADDVLDVGMAVARELRSHGVIVDETRTENKRVELEDRAKFANKKDYDYFVSFHRNSFSSSAAHGVETFTSKGASVKSRELAEKIQKALVDIGYYNRGVKAENFYVLRNTKAPAVLIEIGFISNDKDNQIFDAKKSQIIKAISGAILDQLGM